MISNIADVLVELLNGIGGTEVLVRDEKTVIVCGDNELAFSGKIFI